MQTHIQTIGVKEFHTNLPKIARAVRRGTSYIVMKHARPLFRIEPMQKDPAHRKYTFEDLMKLRFRNGEKNLSQRVDEIVYGA